MPRSMLRCCIPLTRSPRPAPSPVCSMPGSRLSEEPLMAWKDILGALVRRQELTEAEAAWAMEQIVTGEASPAQIAGFALLLRAKGETATEVRGLVGSALR